MRPTRHVLTVNSKRIVTKVLLPDAPLGSPRTLWLLPEVAELIRPGDTVSVAAGYTDADRLWPLLHDAVVTGKEPEHLGKVGIHVRKKE